MVSYRNMTDKELDEYREKSIEIQGNKQSKFEELKRDKHLSKMVFAFGADVRDCCGIRVPNTNHITYC